MTTDLQGNSLTGASAAAAGLYDEAIQAFNIYCGDPMGLLDSAYDSAPGFTMAVIAQAHILMTTSEPGAMNKARILFETASKMQLNDRERSHLSALEKLTRGEWTNAALALDRHNVGYPRDLLALQAGHLVDFLRGNARNLRDRIARVLPAWPEDMPGYSILLGMHAFGLEECGDYARAEAAGRKAVALQPRDCWAHHAVTHVMEMQGRAEDGIGWMMTREPHWSGEDNAFKVHNWWHRALFHLDLGQDAEALALYDGPIRQEHSHFALDLVDASALLWRLHLTGNDVGSRWDELADAWKQHADGKSYPFNDWHAAMAFLGAERTDDLKRVAHNLRLTATGHSEVAKWARQFGLPLVQGFTAFWRGGYEEAVQHLMPARHIANAFGGSHAQRDIIDWTLAEAAVRGGMRDLARALAHERLTLKPGSRPNRNFLARAAAAVEPRRRIA